MLVVYETESNTGACMYSPLRKNKVGKLISKTGQRIGLQGRLGNHSVRKTCISRLFNSDLPGNCTARQSDYQNLKFLDTYKSPV